MQFALYYAGDGYSTAKKIMGRQSAGQSLLRGVARWAAGEPVTALTVEAKGAETLLATLQGAGYAGEVRWSRVPDLGAAAHSGTLYYPAPPNKELAHARNHLGAGSFSLMGVTHTLSSLAALDQVADLALPPFQAWDACICTSTAAQSHVTALIDEAQHYWRENTGAQRMPRVQTPVIPLGIQVEDFAPGLNPAAAKAGARQALGLGEHDVAVLFAGRLSFHAKANPAPLYQALQACAAGHKGLSLVCIEAGVHGGEATVRALEAARAALAPGVRFMTVDGADPTAYRHAWKAADIFVSLSDNVQETFGLTPVEAMAAGLAVLVSDWNGYKDTVRHGIDGLRVPTVMPPAVAGDDFTTRLALHADHYDLHVGRTSLSTVVDPRALSEALTALVTQPDMRRRLSAAAQERAQTEYDWSTVLPRYEALALELNALRLAHQGQQTHAVPAPVRWPARHSPFEHFAHFASHTLQGNWRVQARPQALERLPLIQGLVVTRYADAVESEAPELRSRLLRACYDQPALNVNDWLSTADARTPAGIRAAMWLWKFDLVQIEP